MEQGFEILEHTADIGIVARGKNLAEVFAQAAKGMFSLITDLNTVEERVERRVKVEAPDIESLLVAWLNELVYLFDTKNMVFKRFEFDEINPTNLTARAYGEKLDKLRHPLKGAIKAATYHMLEVKKEDNHYEARVIFDI